MADGDPTVLAQITPRDADTIYDAGYGPTVLDTVNGKRYRVTAADGAIVLVEIPE